MNNLFENLKAIWEELKNASYLVRIAYLFITAAIVLACWFLFYGNYFQGELNHPDPLKAQEIEPFINGLVLPLLTLGSTLLVIATLRSSNVQNFSNNFFILVEQHHRLVGNIDTIVEGYKVQSKGTSFFDDLAARIAWDYENIPVYLYNDFEKQTDDYEREFRIDKKLAERVRNKQAQDLLVGIYDHYFHIHHSDLSHYFRNLFHIVKFVDRSSISHKQKVEYLKMLRAQLSNYELLLLAYDGLHDYGKEFYPLIEKYELIKSLNNESRLPHNYEKRIIDIKVLMAGYKQLEKQWKVK